MSEKNPDTKKKPRPDNDPDREHIMRYFAYDHLPEALAEVSAPFCALATAIVEGVPRSPERTKALDHLLYSKDAAVRAALPSS